MTITIQPNIEPMMNVSRTLTGINHLQIIIIIFIITNQRATPDGQKRSEID